MDDWLAHTILRNFEILRVQHALCMNRCKSKKGSLRHKSGDRRHRRPETSVRVLDFNLPLKSWQWKYVLTRLVTWYMSFKLLLPLLREKVFMHLAPRYMYCYKRSWGASGWLLSGNCSWLHSCICISILSKLAPRCFDVSLFRPHMIGMQVPKVCHVERVVEVPQVQVQEACQFVSFWVKRWTNFQVGIF